MSIPLQSNGMNEHSFDDNRICIENANNSILIVAFLSIVPRIHIWLKNNGNNEMQ